jgi:murein DD-endopeptidase MepM/ murein hydrolase activator NlpD
VAYSGPSGTIADVASSTPSDRISVYVVRPGDTLSEIASMYDVSVNTIIWANDLKGTNDVHPGDTLIILPVSGIEHAVTKGETLASVAKKYSADPTEIAQYNGLDPTAPLAVGSTIIIPGGELSAPVPAAASRGTIASHGRVISEPYLGGSGASFQHYYQNPVPGGLLTQGLHGWNAVDIAAPRGTPIYAAADGTVIIARNNGGWNGGYGNYVVIDHANGSQTLYAHMAHAIVSPGQTVSAGQVIGYVGMTGMTTGAHVHFEIRGAKNLFAATCSVGERVGEFGCGN